ncbi:MAG: hypothetical protein EXQ79_10120 [Acidimicrobiia bacterium]|nr:hypothetical protein [Acidimicrobiia bacterium]
MTATAPAVSAGGDQNTNVDSPRRDWIWAAAPAVVLVLAAVAWIHEGRGVTFFIDEWQWIIGRHSPSEASLLEPFNNHWMSVPIGIHQAFYRVFGIGSHLPYRLLMLAVHLTTSWLAFTYLRSRISKPLALVGCAVFAFYGYAWTITLWPISLGWAIATAVAVAAFLLVDRETRRADIAVSALLVVGVASTSVAVAFAVGIAAELAMRRAWRRLWIVVVPIVVYGAWFVAYGSGTSDSDSVGAVVKFVEALLARTVATLVGITPGVVEGGLEQVSTAAHIALAVALVAFVALWIVLGRPVTARLVGLVASLGAYSLALAVARASSSQGSYGVTTWYSYPAALLLILILGEMLRGRVVATRWTAVIAVVAIWALVWNIGEMVDGGDTLRGISRIEQAQLLATDLSVDRVPLGFHPGVFLKDVTAGPYFRVEREYGTPAFTIAELRDAPLDARRAADDVIVRAMGVKTAGAGFEVPTPACTSGAVQRVTSAVVLVEGGVVKIGVFDRAGREIEGPGGLVTRIDLPPLGDPDLRWIIRAQGDARVCTLPGSAGGLT